MTKIITNDEIKVILGISGTSSDALVEIWNNIATEILTSALETDNLLSHAVVNERVKLYSGETLIVEDFPVDISVTPTVTYLDGDSITDKTFSLDTNGSRRINVLDSSGDPSSIYGDEVLVSYTAGYTAQETNTVLLYASLVGKTITAYVAGTATTYTFVASGATTNQINANTDNDTTAANIATALSGSSSGAVVTLPLGTRIVLGTATSAMLTITAATIPEMLKSAVALVVGGGMAEREKKGGVVAYTLGSKSVTFKNDNDKSVFEKIIDIYLPNFRKTRINSI